MPMIKHGVGTLGDSYTIRTNEDGKKVAIFDTPTTKSSKEATHRDAPAKAKDDDDDDK